MTQLSLAASNSDLAAEEGKTRPRDWSPANYDLRDAWFPVTYSRLVTNKPTRRIVHSQPYYLWRDPSQHSGRAQAAEFHPEMLGKLRAQASEFTGGSGIYPTVERYGYVWAWYGNPDNANPELIPNIPFLPVDGSNIPVHMQRTARFDASSPLSVENLIDLTHADFLHADTIGDGLSASDIVECEWTSETVTRTRIVSQKSVAPVMRWIGGVRAKYQDLRAVLHVHVRSGVTISYPRFRPGHDIPNVQPFVPVGRFRSIVNVTQYAITSPFIFRMMMPRIAYLIQPQDNSVVRPQTERYIDDGQRRDLHSRFDKPGFRYRHLLEQLAERQRNGDYSYLNDAEPGRDISQLLGMDR